MTNKFDFSVQAIAFAVEKRWLWPPIHWFEWHFVGLQNTADLSSSCRYKFHSWKRKSVIEKNCWGHYFGGQMPWKFSRHHCDFDKYFLKYSFYLSKKNICSNFLKKCKYLFKLQCILICTQTFLKIIIKKKYWEII